MRHSRISIASIALLMAIPAVAAPQASLAGRWQTVDDDTGQAKSVVEIHRVADGTFAGKVVEILDTRNGANPACDKCRGSQRGKPIKGMVILWGLKADHAHRWNGGTVLDPENGKTYKAKIELLDGGTRLGMSGCIVFICRQQVWRRQ